MSPTPTAKLFGKDLVFTRTFKASAEDVWASVTEPERTARWFGPWTGDAAPGRTIKVQMAYEEGDAPIEMRIDACEAPRHLELFMDDEAGAWHIDITLSEEDGRTELRFVQHLTTTEGVGDVGPGWEYYLDMLVAAHNGTPQPKFDDYYPAQKAYFDSQR